MRFIIVIFLTIGTQSFSCERKPDNIANGATRLAKKLLGKHSRTKGDIQRAISLLKEAQKELNKN